jgi:hypothetical protein
VHGEKELVEKLGRNDPCPCGSGKRFQTVLHELGPVSTGANGRIIGVDGRAVAKVAVLTSFLSRGDVAAR